MAQVLPELAPILKKKAKDGDIAAIKELHDRVMGKSAQPLEGPGDNGEIIVKWQQ